MEMPPAEAVPEPLRQFLLVRVAGMPLGLRLDAVREVVTARPLTRLPGAPASVAGMVNLRGRILTVVNLTHPLGGAAEPAPGHRLVVVRHGGRDVGIAVDDVLRIIAVPESALAQPEGERGPSAGPHFLTGTIPAEQAPFRAVALEALLEPIFG